MIRGKMTRHCTPIEVDYIAPRQITRPSCCLGAGCQPEQAVKRQRRRPGLVRLPLPHGDCSWCCCIPCCSARPVLPAWPHLSCPAAHQPASVEVPCRARSLPRRVIRRRRVARFVPSVHLCVRRAIGIEVGVEAAKPGVCSWCCCTPCLFGRPPALPTWPHLRCPAARQRATVEVPCRARSLPRRAIRRRRVARFVPS